MVENAEDELPFEVRQSELVMGDQGGSEGRKRIRGRRDCFLLPWKAADEETGTAAVGKSQIACHQPTAHWSV